MLGKFNRGRIITFYSYKGGTGRSMALANVAWLLASSGRRVLAIDWDLEAPGLHCFFAPFLADKTLRSSGGIIDFFLDYSEAAIRPDDLKDNNWFEPYSDLLQYAMSLDWPEFPEGGTIDFVPAGRQDGTYSHRVNSFDWSRLYEKFGGTLFLEAVKQRLRADYDFILIDSRTGASDTAGICTIQMPDQLVACFTYNTQSVAGTAAIAHSILRLRRETIRIWPVPMRVESVEKQRLEHVRRVTRRRLSPLLSFLHSEARDRYWNVAEVPYYPSYSYEEVLATFADRPEESYTLLSAFERLTAYLTDGQITRLNVPPSDERRQNVLSDYNRQIEEWDPSTE